MQILPNGYAVSETALKALDAFLYDKTQWITEKLVAEKGNAKEKLVATWLPMLFMDLEVLDVPKDQDEQVMLIVSMPYYTTQGNTPRDIIPEKESPLDAVLFNGGFSIDDASWAGLCDAWTDPEAWLQWKISDMIQHAKKEFRILWNRPVVDDKTIQYLPKTDKEFISIVTARDYYKTKKQLEDAQGVTQ